MIRDNLGDWVWGGAGELELNLWATWSETPTVFEFPRVVGVGKRKASTYPCRTRMNARPHASNSTVSPVAIIGAGPGGLAAAVLLAASGVPVRVYEAGPQIGGRTTRVSQDGFHFDKGPTFFMMPYVLEEIFKAAGKSMNDYVHLDRLDPMYRLLIGRPGHSHLTLDATQNIEEMGRRISAIDAEDGKQFGRFIEDNRYKLRHSESILRNPMRSPLDLFKSETWLDTLKVGPVLAPHLSVHELLGKYFKNPFVKLAVSFQSKYLGMSPFECPSLFTILPFIEYEYGIWHPRGGCHALMQGMAKLATDLGAEIVCDCPVVGIDFASASGAPKATHVRLGAGALGENPYANQRVAHEHVVINADASWAIKNLIPADVRTKAHPKEYSNEHLDSRRYSCSTYMLYLGVEGEVDLPHHTIYVSEKYRENLEDITTNGRLSEEPSIYVCNPSRIDPTMAPKGKSALYVLMPTPNCKSGVNWEANAAMLRERTLDQMEKRMGLKDIRKRIVTEVPLTPDDWKRANINFGATFNLAHNLGQMLHKRPQNKLKGYENLYLVGGGTHPGSGLPTIFLSAQISSKLLCEQLGVAYAGNKEEVKQIARSRAFSAT